MSTLRPDNKTIEGDARLVYGLARLWIKFYIGMWVLAFLGGGFMLIMFFTGQLDPDRNRPAYVPGTDLKYPSSDVAADRSLKDTPDEAADAVSPLNEVRPVLADASLYERPDVSSGVIDRIHQGARVRIVGETHNFFKVRKLSGSVGFAPRNSIGD